MTNQTEATERVQAQKVRRSFIEQFNEHKKQTGEFPSGQGVARSGVFGCRKLGAWLACAILACLTATSGTAAPLACVRRAIDWHNSASSNPAYLWRSVSFAMVALHETGLGAYAFGGLGTGSNCPVNPLTIKLDGSHGRFDCLAGIRQDAQLLKPGPLQVNNVLGITVDAIADDDSVPVHFHQANAAYLFYGACVGNLLVGSDQWGNRWTVSFSLYEEPIPPR